MSFIKKENLKNKAFSLYEIIISIFIISIILNFSFVKYRDAKDLRDINEAKAKISEAFFVTSSQALKTHKRVYLDLDLINKKIVIYKRLNVKNEIIHLPKNLLYYHTYPIKTDSFNITFTQNGNISKSFSIYIFDRNKNARYKISLYGFDRSKFLKVNNYRKFSKKNIKLKDIVTYHSQTNEDRESFYQDWRKE